METEVLKGVTPDKEKEGSILEKAEAIAKRIEEANLKAQELLKLNTELETRRILGGRTEAGQSQVIINPEEERRNKLKEYWKGSAIEQAFK